RVAGRGLPARVRAERGARSPRRAALRTLSAPRDRGDLQGLRPRAARRRRARPARGRRALGAGSAVAPMRATAVPVDYGAGNRRSVAKALERSGLAVEVTADPGAVRRADAVVLPGVGAFRDARQSLADKHLDDAVRTAIDEGRPYLGLCLGLQ